MTYTPSPLVNLIPNPALVGHDVNYEGHSYAAGTGGDNAIGYPQRVTARQIFRSAGYNAVGGRWMADTAMRQIATIANQSGPSSAGRFYLFDSIINDVIATTVGGGTTGAALRQTAQSLAGMQNSLAYILATLQGSARVEANNGSVFSLTGTWAADTTINNGGYPASNKYTTTQNDFVDITVTLPAGVTSLKLVLYGIDDTRSTITGAAFSVKQGATTLVTGTTSNQYLRGGNGAPTGTAWVACPMIVNVTGLTAGAANTIRLTKTDATGSRLWAQAVITPRTATSFVWPCVVVKACPTSFSSITDPDVAAYNAVVDTVVASFGLSDTSIVVADPSTVAGGWVKATYLQASDGLHPSERGHAVYADIVNTAINSIAYNAAYNNL